MSEVPDAFQDAPEEVKQMILSKTGNDSIQPEDVQTYFSGDLETNVQPIAVSTTDVPPFENLED